ncbi:MAG: hypothetical protein Pg6A_12370 [Termitinemataceae bacterium]|nr:MAG: hypothetical protein Pg6A_12370 [Termitinemataceae bacterium]
MGNITLIKEEAFHDEWADSIDINTVMVDESFECATAPENRFIMQKLGDISGKKILELGAGAGEASVYFAKKGADVTATDLSGGMLQVVTRLAAKYGVSVKTEKCASDALPFANNSFDIVYAANLLHHVDIAKTIKEAHRVLKPGGCFISFDPLAHNPIINIYRRLASGVRTPDEHPIKMKQLAMFKETFGNISFHTTWLFSNLIFVKMFFIEKIDPNKERYWNRKITRYSLYEKLYIRLEKFDRIFLKVFPFMRRYCWNIVIFCSKK